VEVVFRDIDEANFEECVELKVREDQPFVAPNTYSIAQSKIQPWWIIKAIYAGEKMVGFAMYTIDDEKAELYLCRFMIDQRYQGNGFGRAALDILKSTAMNESGVKRLRLSTEPNNHRGIRIYENFGFVDTGEMEDGEEVFVLELNKD
jgi:diamine N-acetyltransferase